MLLFDPNLIPGKVEEYLSHYLDSAACFCTAERLTKSSRAAPWRFEVLLNGKPRSFVLQLDLRRGEHEFHALRAMENIPLPAPRAYGWDPIGEALGVPCYFSDYLHGESLLGPLLAGETWAERLYLDTVCSLQEITPQQLDSAEALMSSKETALHFLEEAHAYFSENPHPLADQVYQHLYDNQPLFPEPRFSNGDLWLDNFIVLDGKLVGVIDFENAGFSDPIYEFLLAFFVEPKLRGRGIEQRYCRRMGYDPRVLPWYNGLEYLDTWAWVRKNGESFVHYTDEKLQEAMEGWLLTWIQ